MAIANLTNSIILSPPLEAGQQPMDYLSPWGSVSPSDHTVLHSANIRYSCLTPTSDESSSSILTTDPSDTQLGSISSTVAASNATKKKKNGKRSSGSYKHVPHREKPPHLVARRNARERRRVQAVNGAFARLRRCVPVENRSKRLSKVKTLQRAIEYISALKRLLESSEDQKPEVTSSTGNLLLEGEEVASDSYSSNLAKSEYIPLNKENNNNNEEERWGFNCHYNMQHHANHQYSVYFAGGSALPAMYGNAEAQMSSPPDSFMSYNLMQNRFLHNT